MVSNKSSTTLAATSELVLTSIQGRQQCTYQSCQKLCVCVCVRGGETQQNRQRGNAKATIEQSQQSLLRHLNQLCRNSLDFGDEVWYVAGNTSNMKRPFSDMILRTHVHVAPIFEYDRAALILILELYSISLATQRTLCPGPKKQVETLNGLRLYDSMLNCKTS